MPSHPIPLFFSWDTRRNRVRLWLPSHHQAITKSWLISIRGLPLGIREEKSPLSTFDKHYFPSCDFVWPFFTEILIRLAILFFNVCECYFIF